MDKSVKAARSPAEKTRSSEAWLTGQQSIQLGPFTLQRGLIYVGEQLPPQNGNGRDNCLIVPSLPLARHSDVVGQYLDYWPSYERLAPASRRAYIEWLASDRSDPGTNIGYVFLYFYGLERRLMLERAAGDRPQILAEVDRLRTIYGSNRSFDRYSRELLSAAAIVAGGNGGIASPAPSIGAGDVPLDLKIVLGHLAATRRPLPAPLLLAFAANHPETRLRTPARRLTGLLETRFNQRVTADFPNGFVLPLSPSWPRLELSYRAASGTFEVPILPGNVTIPDLGRLTEPLGYARRLIEEICVELDSYSREIGRQGATTVTLATLGKLPLDLRGVEASGLTGDPLGRLQALADSHVPAPLPELLAACGLAPQETTKSNLKELSRCLRDWGLGAIPDPLFAPRILPASEQVMIFRFDIREEIPQAPSGDYQLAFLTLSLGMLVARADGTISASERDLLGKIVIDSPGLSNNERRRLLADLRWLETGEYDLSNLKNALSEIPSQVRDAMIDGLFTIARADGALAQGEVALLERVAKLFDIEQKALYQRFNVSTKPPVAAPVVAVGTRPKPAPTGVQIDSSRLQNVRINTAEAAAMLAELFAEEEHEPPPPSPTQLEGRLDERTRGLVDELTSRPQWTRADFDRLAREAGMLPGRLITLVNEWSIETFDELLLEGDDPIVINSVVLENV